jgi:hypothetical protein
VSLVFESMDAVAASGPALWATSELKSALITRKVLVVRAGATDKVLAVWLPPVIASANSAVVQQSFGAATLGNVKHGRWCPRFRAGRRVARRTR